MAKEELQALTAWPKNKDGMSVDLLLRIVGCDTQREYLKKWAQMEQDRDWAKSDLYAARTLLIISSVGLMACLRALDDVNPARAEAFIKDYWTMCDAGDSFGEMLWEFTQEAGLDPQLVKDAMTSKPENVKG